MSDAAAEIRYQAKKTRRKVFVAAAYVNVSVLLVGATVVRSAPSVAGLVEAGAITVFYTFALAFLIVGYAGQSGGRCRWLINLVPKVDITEIERDSVGDRS